VTTLLAGQPYNGGGLTAATAYSGAAASSRILRAIAGTNRLYYEMAYGKTIAGSPQCSPSRPCGGVGHDHTGGYMGRALKHTIYSAAFTPVTGGPDSGDYVVPPAIYTSLSPGTYTTVTYEIRVPVPACDLQSGAYLSLSCGASFYVDLSDGDAPESYAFRALFSSDATGISSTSYAVAIEAESTGYISGTAVSVPFIPGTENRLRIVLLAESEGPAGAYLAALHISQAA